MSIFKKIGSFFSKPEVQKAVKETAKVVASGATVGKALNLAMDLGAFNFMAKLVGKSVKKVSNLDDDISVKLLQIASKSVVETQLEIEAGKLTTSDQKRAFAQERFKFYMVNDAEMIAHPSLINIAPVIIQYVFEAGKLKVMLDSQNRKELGSLMMNIGSRAILDPTVDPVKEFFEALEVMQEQQG